MKLCPTLAGMALAAHAGFAFAQTNVGTTDPIVVTATRTARTADETLGSVTIITREDIERRQSQDLVDLLRAQASIDITQSGGPGGNIDLFLRGTNQEHVLVLIDGVRVASTSTGVFEWRSLPLTQIERIEIVRGPRAALYGSDAIGGVIQIFTRRATGFDGAMAVGSDRTRRAEIAWGNAGRVHVFVTGSHFETEGFSAQNERGGSFNPDADGSRLQGISAGFAAKPSDNTRFELNARQSRSFIEFDEGTAGIDNGSLSARLVQTVTSAWTQSLILGAMNDDLLFHTSPPARIRTERHTVDWQNDFVLDADSLLTVGFAYFEESGVSMNPSSGVVDFDRRQRDRAAFALWQRRFGKNDVQLSGRYDDYNTVDDRGTWGVAYGRTLSRETRAWVSYGTAFRAPTLNDLFHPGFGGFFAGNPNLVPETSRTGEIGLRRTFRENQFASIAIFSTHVDNLISSSGPNFQSINIDEARIRGTEIEYRYDRRPWHISSTLTLQRARDETTGGRLPRRADTKFSALVERRFGRGAVGAEIVAASDRFDGAFSNVTVAGHGIVNAAARYYLGKFLSLEGRIENLLDKEYEVVNGFNTADRSLFVTLRYQSTSRP